MKKYFTSLKKVAAFLNTHRISHTVNYSFNILTSYDDDFTSFHSVHMVEKNITFFDKDFNEVDFEAEYKNMLETARNVMK